MGHVPYEYFSRVIGRQPKSEDEFDFFSYLVHQDYDSTEIRMEILGVWDEMDVDMTEEEIEEY